MVLKSSSIVSIRVMFTYPSHDSIAYFAISILSVLISRNNKIIKSHSDKELEEDDEASIRRRKREDHMERKVRHSR